MNRDIKDFWDERAALGVNSGSDDFLIKEIEQKAILSKFEGRKNVLEIGCGNGDTAIIIARRYGCKITATDFSEKMIELAEKNLALPENEDVRNLISLRCGSVTDANFLSQLGSFDTVLSQRALINLPTAEEQACAIKNIANVLDTEGLYIMSENCQEGLDRINELRVQLSLPAISAPWHNRYFREAEIQSYSNEHFKLTHNESFASTYYFLSRVINASLASQENRQPEYGAPVNLLARHLPALIDGYGQSRLWIFRKEK